MLARREPACVVAKISAFRLVTGRSSTRFASTTPPTDEVAYAKSVLASATTSTLSLVVETSSVRSSDSFAPTSNRILSSVLFLNPGCSALSLYSPGFKATKMNSPPALLSILVDTPVCLFSASTLAFGTTAPEESRTVPPTDPSVIWPNATVAKIKKTRSISSQDSLKGREFVWAQQESRCAIAGHFVASYKSLPLWEVL